MTSTFGGSPSSGTTFAAPGEVLVLRVGARGDQRRHAGAERGEQAVAAVLDDDAVARRQTELLLREVVDVGVRLLLLDDVAGEHDLEPALALGAEQVEHAVDRLSGPTSCRRRAGCPPRAPRRRCGDARAQRQAAACDRSVKIAVLLLCSSGISVSAVLPVGQPLCVEVVRHALFAAGDLQQLAVELDVPFGVDAGLRECAVERDAMRGPRRRGSASSSSASSPGHPARARRQVERRRVSSASATTAGSQPAGLRLELGGIGAGGDRRDPEPVRVRLQHLDGLAADAPGRAEQRDAEPRAPVSRTSATAYSATTGRGEQERVDPVQDRRRGPGSASRSPWRPAARLSIDSARSPACAASPSSGPEDQRRRAATRPSPREHQRGDHGRSDEPADQPLDRSWPARCGSRNRWRPNCRPDEVGAGVVASRRPSTSSRIQPRSGPSASSGAPAGIAGPTWPTWSTNPSSADVDRAEHGRDPGDQPVARVGPRERADAREHDRPAPTSSRPLSPGRRGPPPRARTQTASAGPEQRQRRVARRRAAAGTPRTREPPRSRRARRRSRSADPQRRRAGPGRGRARTSARVFEHAAASGPAAQRPKRGCGGRIRASAASRVAGAKSGQRRP